MSEPKKMTAEERMYEMSVGTLDGYPTVYVSAAAEEAEAMVDEAVAAAVKELDEEMDEALERIACLERERDESRAEVKRLREALGSLAASWEHWRSPDLLVGPWESTRKYTFGACAADLRAALKAADGGEVKL